MKSGLYSGLNKIKDDRLLLQALLALTWMLYIIFTRRRSIVKVDGIERLDVMHAHYFLEVNYSAVRLDGMQG